MTFSEFRDCAITSAELYYDYLQKEGKGIASTSVRDYSVMNNGFVKLMLSGRLASLDDIQIKIQNRVYTPDELKPIRYDKDERSLLVRPRENLRNIFFDLSARDILVIADLKFLVRRVGIWYKSHSSPFGLPSFSPCISPQMPHLKDQPSTEQEMAFHGIFQNPLTYIWGAPGTGKTQFVLARAVLAYCLEGKQVLITAPTNNAVEQTLKGVLSVLSEAEIPFDKVIRLGTPSKEFYDQYPMVCEVRAIENELIQMQEQLAFYKKCLNYHSVLQWYTHADTVLIKSRQRLSDIEVEYSDLSIKAQQTVSLHKAKSARFSPILTEIENLNVKRDSFAVFINKKRSRASAWFQRKRLEQAQTELSSVVDRLQELGTEYEQLLQEVDDLQSEIGTLNEQKKSLEREIDSIISDLKTLPPCSIKNDFSVVLSNLQPNSEYKQILSSASMALGEIKSLIDSRAELYSGISPENANDKIAQIEQRKAALDSQSVASRLADCFVVAATVDGYISKVSDNDAFQPVHIFLDEAAYCPLIKCATLLSAGVPLTLLGDHKQLPPVCEASQGFLKVLENESVCLWAQSALFVDEIFDKSMSALSFEYQNTDDPQFCKLAKYDLLQTFRFGNELAHVLAHFVYTCDFCGNPNVNTGIYYLPVHRPSAHDKTKRQNKSECLAIQSILQSASFQNYAVLTPYRGQRELLSRKYVSPDDVFTIHGSQGREWETVILSVVETTRHWFLSPVLINTAVSRAKKRLIIVCDAEYWKWRENHIIGGLLSVATPYLEH